MRDAITSPDSGCSWPWLLRPPRTTGRRSRSSWTGTSGPYVISLWTHPDVGTGTFWVMMEPPRGAALPKDLKIEIGVQPVSGRLPEKRYAARLDSSSAQVQYVAEVPFDAQELWRIHLLLDSSAGHGESTATVEVTPPGLGRWDLLWRRRKGGTIGCRCIVRVVRWEWHSATGRGLCSLRLFCRWCLPRSVPPSSDLDRLHGDSVPA